ncbi:LacI family transcriptional regulator [Bifidobacterium sp. DSM 109957]|uniref:LacI family transcriptional regulator n=1 Tax=Bifidobacterium oedipodis TaxID=2675322 RepID=A0A7Y0ERN8_9BIFI|nr:LacI family transcriptional regulator [Bifidobacterium sp. DSM 109957]
MSTVGRAFTNPGRVSAKTREHVLAVAADMGYQVSRSASALKSGQSKRFALLMNETLTSWFNASVLSGINSVLQPEGYDISFYERIDAVDTRHRFFDTLPLRRNADAVIVASFAIDPHEVEQLRTLHVPIIGINVPSTEGFDGSISIDDREGMRLAAQHLIHLGHRDLVYLCSEMDDTVTLTYSTDMRLFGFEDACQAASEPIRAQVISLPRDREQAIESAVAQLFALNRFPTGICCQSDGLALPLISRLHQYGRNVPDDCSVIGFDDMVFASDFGLTTIRQHPFDMGATAAHKALTLIEGQFLPKAHETAPIQLVPRQTDTVPRH